MMKHQCNVVRVDNVALCSLWAFSWRFKQEWLGVEKGQSQGSRARNMGFQGKDGTIARSWWWKMGASVVRSLNFLSVPIFVAFKSPFPARRRVMLDLIVGARKNHANACNALLHHLPFSLHQSGQRCLFITFGSNLEWSRALHCCVQEKRGERTLASSW